MKNRKEITTSNPEELWALIRVRNSRKILKRLAKDDAELIKVASDALRLCSELPLKLGDELGAQHLVGLANLLSAIRV